MSEAELKALEALTFNWTSALEDVWSASPFHVEGLHPEIAKALKTRESMLIDELEQTTHKHIIIQSDATLHWEQYDIC